MCSAGDPRAARVNETSEKRLLTIDLTSIPTFQFIVAALALVAVADRPQPSYRPRPAYAPAPTYSPAPSYAAPTYAPAPAYKAQPQYAPAPSYGHSASYKPIAILEQEDVHPGDGTYRFHFSTENGIYR